MKATSAGLLSRRWVAGAAVWPHEPVCPEDVAEVVAEETPRDLRGLRDGDEVAITVPEGAP